MMYDIPRLALVCWSLGTSASSGGSDREVSKTAEKQAKANRLCLAEIETRSECLNFQFEKELGSESVRLSIARP